MKVCGDADARVLLIAGVLAVRVLTWAAGFIVARCGMPHAQPTSMCHLAAESLHFVDVLSHTSG
ncbi:MAG: hypothetical protein LBQ32_12115 [Burkholderiaceae bacterium]|jgi:hypothetical protein|nr:hypothetical protein [Burkholderiaceae bacterium]